MLRDRLEFANDHAKRDHDRPGAGGHRPGNDHGIAEAEFLDREPVSDPQKPREQKPNSADHKSDDNLKYPRCAERPRSRRRHDTVILCAPPTDNCRGSSDQKPASLARNPRSRASLWSNSTAGLILPPDRPYPNCCTASGQLRHISQLPGKATALYGCRGMRPKSAKAGPSGTPGYQ